MIPHDLWIAAELRGLFASFFASIPLSLDQSGIVFDELEWNVVNCDEALSVGVGEPLSPTPHPWP